MAFEFKANPAGGSSPQPRAFGQFYLHELINSGGMADIWVATDASGQTYALRKLHDRLRLNFIARGRFFRGCEILAQIPGHPGIVRYLQHGSTDGIPGTPFLLMEYNECSNLRQLATRTDPQLTDNIAQILIDLAEAVQHLHDTGFMHLDLKPENVVVTRSGLLRVVDFDLAQPRPAQPKKMARNPGTPNYMAPEQLLRAPFDHRVDIFAFGVTAYELLTYQKPFPAETPAEVLQQHRFRSGSFLTPREHNSDLPFTLEKIILRCLEFEADRRYADMAMVTHELKQALYLEP